VHQVAIEYIEGNGLTGMSKVGISINRRTTGIKTHKRRIEGLKGLFFPGEGIIEIKLVAHNYFGII
jgi:hypothetical protein